MTVVRELGVRRMREDVRFTTISPEVLYTVSVGAEGGSAGKNVYDSLSMYLEPQIQQIRREQRRKGEYRWRCLNKGFSFWVVVIV